MSGGATSTYSPNSSGMSHTRSSPYRRRRRSLVAAAILLSSACLPVVSAQSHKSAADYFVSSLPGAPFSEQLRSMYAGHVEVTPEHHGNLFFWLFKNRHVSDRRRTVLWLNGGPGCSSMDGAMMEVGPYRVTADGTLRINEGSWDEFANLLFVDNPVGTGFSYVDGDSYLHELQDMADQYITFLEKWFALFPEHAEDDLYLAGESYAGQHIPYIAQAILDHNEQNGQKWNLSGLLIGNGWISGPDQYPAYLPFAYEAGLVDRGSTAEAQILEQQERCMKDLDAGGKDLIDSNSCEQILQEILRTTIQDNMCWNMYDVRLKDEYPSCGMAWPPDLANVTPYLRREDVVQALHINADKHSGWQECSGQVSREFTTRNSQPSSHLLPALLEKMPIILFSGDKDLICNHIGTENLISSLEWNGAKGMELTPGVTAPRRDWTFEGLPAGQYQTARNLTYIRFYNSSHMVPFDYPRRTRDMLDRFLGVDIASIGGTPADSRIDGEKAHPETSVGGHPNSTAAQEAEDEKVEAAKWLAYQRSGEVALFFCIIGLCAWGFLVWRARRRQRGYGLVFGDDPYDGSDGHAARLFRGRGSRANGRQSGLTEARDVEAAREFDESELDNLTDKPPRRSGEDFVLGEDEEQDERINGHPH